MVATPTATARRIRPLIVVGLIFALAFLAFPVSRFALARRPGSPLVAARQLASKPTATTRADFNGDGFADLAVGVPGESQADGVLAAGAVSVIYGSTNGLTSNGNQLWSQDSADVLDAPQK